MTKDVAADIQDLAGRLRGLGLRITRQRMAIIAALCSAPGALSHQRLLDAAKPHCFDLGLATVYRTVDLLERYGCVRRVMEADGRDSVAVARLRTAIMSSARNAGAWRSFLPVSWPIPSPAQPAKPGSSLTGIGWSCWACAANAPSSKEKPHDG